MARTVLMVGPVPRSVEFRVVSVLSVDALPSGLIDRYVVVASCVLVVGVSVSKAVVVVGVLRVVLIVVEAVTSVVVVTEVDRVVGIGLPVVGTGVIVGPAIRVVELFEGSTTAVAALMAGVVDAGLVGM